MPTKRLSVDLEEQLSRRFRARLAYIGTSMTHMFTEWIEDWLGSWGDNTVTHTVAAGEDLRRIAQQYYSDPELYMAIAYFNDISYPLPLPPGRQIQIPEPGTAPGGLAPETNIPWGMPKSTASVNVAVDIHRRFRARAAFEGTTMTDWLYQFVARWTGGWPDNTVTYTVKSGDTLGDIAFRYYSDAAKYWVLAHYNGIHNPALIQVGQQLVIPEPVTSGQLPAGESPYIFGIHDRGGEHLMAEKEKKGWILITEQIGRNPYDQSGKYYLDLTDSGYGVIVRLNHGYHDGAGSYPGTIPEQDASEQNYQDFAVRCGNFVEQSTGCHIWIIGNEMNHENEWPGGPEGQPITPERYAECFRRCRQEIHNRPGHEDDQVVVGAVAPWHDRMKYSENERGDWVKYLADILALVKSHCDGIALHTYTHGPDKDLITSKARMEQPFEDRYYEFRAYREFLAAIPPSLRGLPVYITETDQFVPWAPRNTGWVQAAFAEIDEWNQEPTHQKIRCLLLYRWQRYDRWAFRDILEVQDDFRAALDNDYRWWR
jgi:LysM repeat protein